MVFPFLIVGIEPFVLMNYTKNRYTWKECTGNFVFYLFFVKQLKKFGNIPFQSQKCGRSVMVEVFSQS